MIDSHQKDGTPLNFYSDLIYNCSYSGINQLKGDVAGPTVKLIHEIAEIVFINSPILKYLKKIKKPENRSPTKVKQLNIGRLMDL